MVKYKEESVERSGTTIKLYDVVVRYFCPTLKGNGNFSSGVVKTLVRSAATASGLFLAGRKISYAKH